MLIKLIKDVKQRNRYQQLTPAEQEQVMQIVKRHIAACARQNAPAELEATFREAIELVTNHDWEPEQKWERAEPFRRYDVYLPPIKEAA
jgi:hypothetical protein